VLHGLRSVDPGRFPEWSFPCILGLFGSPLCCTNLEVLIRDVSPNRVSRAFFGFWGPQSDAQASKWSSGTFPRIEFPGHSWASGVPNVLYGLRSVHPGRFPESSFPCILGLLGPPLCRASLGMFIRDVSSNRVSRAFLGFWVQYAVRASKCSCGMFPRIEFPGHSWVSGVPTALCKPRSVHPGRFPDRVSRAFLGCSGPQCIFRASKCLSGTFPRLEFLGHSWAVLVPNVFFGLRNANPGFFSDSSFLGIPGSGPQSAVRASKCSSGFLGHSWAVLVPN
jgi:hypothetical protein